MHLKDMGKIRNIYYQVFRWNTRRLLENIIECINLLYWIRLQQSHIENNPIFMSVHPQDMLNNENVRCKL